ncbi:hypothetical protein JG687_00006966 [Phytophthora cactorum]|uniref:Uncharacterized protein n=1 Tax=Phytophthora cactorum TaxID=29920 RepID=A0A8T1UL42_9STRA|nr:hypothetical protein JG687_00006966 [Phytophthora cactorum]
MATAVKRSFDRLPSARIDKYFVTLQNMIQTIISHGGENNYKLARVNKEHSRGSSKPRSLLIEEDAVDYGFSQHDSWYLKSYCNQF